MRQVRRTAEKSRLDPRIYTENLTRHKASAWARFSQLVSVIFLVPLAWETRFQDHTEDQFSNKNYLPNTKTSYRTASRAVQVLGTVHGRSSYLQVQEMLHVRI
jgi:hypothetical protein